MIGCSTNRLASTFQLYGEEISENSDIREHIEIAKDAYDIHHLNIETVPVGTPLAGMFLMFRKSLWNEVKFEEKSIQFDLIFSDTLHSLNKKLGIARGIYLFHIYRLGSENPASSISHIAHCQDFSKVYTPKGANNG